MGPQRTKRGAHETTPRAPRMGISAQALHATPAVWRGLVPGSENAMQSEAPSEYYNAAAEYEKALELERARDDDIMANRGRGQLQQRGWRDGARGHVAGTSPAYVLPLLCLYAIV